jgi:O-antigen/teichoic acid export membrane protein
MKIKSINRRIALNTSTNFIKYGSQVIIAFIMTPFIIKSVGDSFYGVWVVILSFAGYAAILEFGVQESLVKLVSKYEALDDEGKINQVFSIAFLFMASLAILSFSILFWVVPGLLPRLLGEGADLEIARILLIIVAVDSVLMLMNFAFSGMVYGFQLYHIKNTIDIFIGLVSPLVIYVLIRLDYGVLSLAYGTILFNALNLLVFAALCKYHFRPLRLVYGSGSYTALREILAVSSRLFTSATALRLARNSQPLVIAWYLPPIWNAFYAVPARLADYGTELLYVLSRGFMPIFSEYHSRSDRAAIRELYFRFTRFIVAGFFPLILSLYVFGESFLAIWMSAEYAEKGKWVLQFLTLSILVQSAQPLWAKLLVGVERLNVIVAVNVSVSVVQVVLGIVLVSAYGINGMALSILVAMVISQFVYFRYVANYLEVSAWQYVSGCHLRAAVASVVFLAIVLFLKASYPPQSYLDIFWQTSAGLAAYIPLAWFLVLSREERRLFNEKVAALFGAGAAREIEP